MTGLHLPTGPLTILCIGAHPDDIEIGCGGSMLQLLEQHPGSTVGWVVLSATDERAHEAQSGAATFTARAGALTVVIQRFRDGYFPALNAEIKDVFESLKQTIQIPDLVFTHYHEDRHQDHRLVSDLTWQTFRSHLILEYEIPKYDGDLGTPNFFIPVAEAYRRLKIEALLETFPSQRGRHWFTAETFQALMRLRGIESAAPEGYAEAFHVRKALLLGGTDSAAKGRG